MISAIKSPTLVAARCRAEEKPRTITLSAATAIVKTHGLDFAILLASLVFIGYAACY